MRRLIILFVAALSFPSLCACATAGRVATADERARFPELAKARDAAAARLADDEAALVRWRVGIGCAAGLIALSGVTAAVAHETALRVAPSYAETVVRPTAVTTAAVGFGVGIALTVAAMVTDRTPASEAELARAQRALDAAKQ